MEIKFKGFYTKKDVFNAVFLANKPPQKNERIRKGVAILALVIYIAYTVLTAVQDHRPVMDIQSLGSHLFFLLLLGIFLFYPNLMSWITATKIWRAPTMHYEYSGVISDTGILYSGKKTLLTWQQIARKQITEEMIVLLTSNGILSFFPRRFFRSEGDWQRVNQLAEKKKPGFSASPWIVIMKIQGTGNPGLKILLPWIADKSLYRLSIKTPPLLPPS